MMIDIHSHILYGMDDGAISLGETIDMLRIASYEGIDTIIATPEYKGVGNIYASEELISRYHQVARVIKKEKIPIKLLLGNELCIDYSSWNELLDQDYFSLNNSQYLLITLPAFISRYNMDNLIYNIQLKGYTPIICHPERIFGVGDQWIISDLIKSGCLVQLNAGSITGMYGDDTMKVALQLLKRHMVHFVATDAHSSLKNSPRLREAYAVVSHKYDEAYAYEVFYKNGLKVVNNQKITCFKPDKKLSYRLKKWMHISTSNQKEYIYNE